MAKKGKQKKQEQGTDNVTQRVEAPAGTEEQSAGAATEGKKGSSAPRARKWDYGIKPEAKVVRLVETANVKRDIQAQFTHTEGDPTVAEFYERGGDRHGLRVMSRRKLIGIHHLDAEGNVVAKFPTEYVKPAPKAEEQKQPEPAAA